MSGIRAMLLDVFNTVLTVDFAAVYDGFVAASGLPKDDWDAGFGAYGRDMITGAMTPEEVYAATFRLAGRIPGDIAALVRCDRELLATHATVYSDVIPFIAELRRRGIGLAMVSNCAPNAGPLLRTLGLAELVDHIFLSCDVGTAKPAAGIYRAALDAFDISPQDAIFVDDQAAYCAGAEALGIKSVRIERPAATPGAVGSLDAVLPML